MSTEPHRSPARALLGPVVGLAVTGTTLLLMAGVGELALRWLRPQPPSWMAIYRRHPTLPFHALEPNASASVDTGESSWSIQTDAAGFRGATTPQAAGACEAWWLGDSFVFGHGVDAEQSVVGRVAAASPAVSQLNTGVPGYGPQQYRQVLEHALGTRPAPRYVFVMTFVGNDFHDTIWDKDVEVHDGVLGHRGDWKSWLKTRLHLYRLASAAYHRLGDAGENRFQGVLLELADPAAWQAEGPLAPAEKTYRAEMLRIAELARAAGAEIRFVVIPTRDAVRAARGEGPIAGEDPQLPLVRARDALAQTGAPVLDATPLLAASDEATYFPFDGHLTPMGNALVAERFLEMGPLACDPGEASP